MERDHDVLQWRHRELEQEPCQSGPSSKRLPTSNSFRCNVQAQFVAGGCQNAPGYAAIDLLQPFQYQVVNVSSETAPCSVAETVRSSAVRLPVQPAHPASLCVCLLSY